MLDFNISASFVVPGPGPGLTYPAPTYAVWDFDDTTATWNTDTTAGTESALNGAIQTAMADAGTVGTPRYHRITWTGGNIAGALTLSFTQATPTRGSVYILVVPSTLYTTIGGSLNIGSGVSDTKFRGFQIQPSSTDYAGGLVRCVNPTTVGGGRRLSFAGNRFGRFWAGGADSTYPEVFGGSSNSGWEIAAKGNDARSIFQFCDARAGRYHFEDNLVTGLVDDFFGGTVRAVSPNICYLYAARNIITDFADNAAYNGFHPDFLQTGVPADVSGDLYEMQVYGNILIGDTTRQYPTHAAILQNEGSASGISGDFRDNVFLCTGLRGIWTPDKTLTIARNLFAWPPLPRAVLTSGTGWTGGPYRQYINGQGDLRPAGTTDIGLYWAGQNAQGSAWALGLNPAEIVSHTVAIDAPTGYQTRFPNMTGLTFDGSSLIIDNDFASLLRTRYSLRSWIEDTYTPRSVALGTGWEANGFNLPGLF